MLDLGAGQLRLTIAAAATACVPWQCAHAADVAAAVMHASSAYDCTSCPTCRCAGDVRHTVAGLCTALTVHRGQALLQVHHGGCQVAPVASNVASTTLRSHRALG